MSEAERNRLGEVWASIRLTKAPKTVIEDSDMGRNGERKTYPELVGEAKQDPGDAVCIMLPNTE